MIDLEFELCVAFGFQYGCPFTVIDSDDGVLRGHLNNNNLHLVFTIG